MKDKFSRTINYARISVTDLCNLRCKYCLPDGCEKKSHNDILSLEQLNTISKALSNLGVNKQRVTGGEPLVRRGIITLLNLMGQNSKISRLGITTNGQNLYEMASDLKTAGVGLLNISLDTLNAAKYQALTGGGVLQDTIKGIDKALSTGFEKVKLNAVLLKGINDDEIRVLSEFANEREVPIRFIELMPFSNQYNFAIKHFISSNDIVKLYKLQKIKNIDSYDKADEYTFDDGIPISFISAISHKFCASCNRVRITSDGKLINCLHHSTEYDLKPYLSNESELENYITKCVYEKPQSHNIDEGVLQRRVMENIGG